MNVYIDSVLQDIRWNGFEIQDNIENLINTCRFEVLSVPTVGSEVEVYNGEDKIFAGEILDVQRRIEGLQEISTVTAVDYTHNLGRSLIVERFIDETVDDILDYLVNTYHIDFTNSSDCITTISRVTFDNISVLDAIQQLADLTNYRWYVDYNKDIHFYASGDEVSPFDLTDTNGKYIFKSLKLVDDISQLRNSVKIRGGEIVGAERTETFDTDGTKNIFRLANKFSEMPTVEYDGSPVTVGVDYLDNEEDFDAFWNFNEKYIRFTTAPLTGTNLLEVTGTPLIPIIVKKTANSSIKEYGLREFFKWDKSLKSEEEVALYADSQLEAYKNSIIEGEFETYEDGLVSGQKINIQSTIRDIDEDFIIQTVSLRMRTPNDPVYRVQLATTRTLGIIQLLQKLLKTEQKILTGEQEQEPLLTYQDLDDEFVINDTLQGSGDWEITEAPYMWMPDDSGDDAATIAANPTKTPIEWNFWVWSA